MGWVIDHRPPTRRAHLGRGQVGGGLRAARHHAFCVVPAALAGDVETAKQHLEEAKGDLKDQNYNSLQESLKNAEEFLEGVPDAERKPVEAELQALKKEAEPKIKAFKAERLTVSLNREIDRAASDVQDCAGEVLPRLKEISAQLDSEDAKKYLDAEMVKKSKARVAGLQQMAFKGAKKRVLENVQPLMTDLEQQIAAEPFKGKNQREVYNIAQSINYLIGRIRAIVEPMPASDPDVKKITDRLAAIDKKIEEMGGASEKAEVVDNMVKGWAVHEGILRRLGSRARRPDLGALHEGGLDGDVGPADAEDDGGDQPDEVLARAGPGEGGESQVRGRRAAQGRGRRGRQDARHGTGKGEHGVQQAARRSREAPDPEQERPRVREAALHVRRGQALVRRHEVRGGQRRARDQAVREVGDRRRGRREGAAGDCSRRWSSRRPRRGRASRRASRPKRASTPPRATSGRAARSS